MSSLPATGVGQAHPKMCLWCGDWFGSTTEKGIHVHEAHPEAIGRGRTRSVGWTCPCDTTNPSSASECTGCGREHWSKT